MHALILGGNGFIGSHLVDELVTQGHSVRVFDRHPEAHREPLAGVDYVLGDFGNRAQVRDALDGIEVVYHLISTTLPQTSNEDPVFDVQSNVGWTLSLLAQCVDEGIRRVVYLSSGGTVYGLPDSLPILEEAPTFPLCSYGITKLCIEKYLELFRHVYGLDYVILRPSNAYGPRQNPEHIQGALTVFLGKALEGRPIVIWGDGSVVRDYIYVEDLVEGIYTASVTAGEHRLFNLGSGVGISLTDLVAMLDEHLQRKTQVTYSESRRFDIPEICLDITRAKRELGWEPRTSLLDGIRLTSEFLTAQTGNDD